MSFAVLLSLGLALLIATSIARQLPFRGGRVVSIVVAAFMATAASVLLTASDPTPAFVASIVGAAIGAILTPRN